jgi:hypothetical protein
MTQAQLDALARGRRINVLNREVMPGLRRDHMTTVIKLFKKPNMHVGVFRVYKLPRTQGLGIPSTNRITKSLHQPLPVQDRHRPEDVRRKAGIRHRSRMSNRVFNLPIPSAGAYESHEAAKLRHQLPLLYSAMLMAQPGTLLRVKAQREYYRVREGVLFYSPCLAAGIERMEAGHTGDISL